MNIFYLSENARQAAEWHCDRHVVKMITETAQMLSAVVRLSGQDIGYRITHKNHPCTKWIMESKQNYQWLRELVYWLHKEWQYRWDHPETKIHKAFEVIESLPKEANWLPDVDMTFPALAMPAEFKCQDPVKSYHNYYIGNKQHLASWKKRGKPDWFSIK